MQCDDTLNLILCSLPTKNYLTMRQINKYYNDFICSNKSNKKRIICIKSENISKLKQLNESRSIPNLYYDVFLWYDIKIHDHVISHLPNLISLSLGDTDLITDSGIKMLTNLESLDLSHNDQITNEGIRHLTNLTYLDLAYNRRITDEVVLSLTKLTKLDLNRNDIINCFDVLPNLTDLSIAGIDIPNKKIQNLTNLTYLNISRSHTITNTGIEQLTGLTKLNIIQNTNITGSGIRNLTNLTELNTNNSHSVIGDVTKLLAMKIKHNVHLS